MNIGYRTIVGAGLMAGALGFCAPAASAMPAFDSGVARQADAAPQVAKVWCGYYGCHRRFYRGGYYRPYGYYRRYGYRHYYGGYGYGPHIGIGIGGIGIY